MGQEGLHASRVALKAVLGSLQNGLTEIQTVLAAAAEVAATDLLTESSTSVSALEDLADFAKFRKQAFDNITEAHRKHIQTLRDAVGVRITLLKTTKGFKA